MYVSVAAGKCAGACQSSYCVAVRVAARYGVGLVEQAVADLACEVGAQAVKLGLERLQLLWHVSRSSLPRGIFFFFLCVSYLICSARLGGVILLGQHLLLEAVFAGGPRRLVLVDKLRGRAGGGRGAAAGGA